MGTELPAEARRANRRLLSKALDSVSQARRFACLKRWSGWTGGPSFQWLRTWHAGCEVSGHAALAAPQFWFRRKAPKSGRASLRRPLRLFSPDDAQDTPAPTR